jgi:hypothetical protein
VIVPPSKFLPTGSESQLTREVPALFCPDLPPCGLIPQVAYRNVNERLRELWSENASTHPNSPTLSSICDMLKDDLEDESEAYPPESLRLTQQRMPWRREEVFAYEVRWAGYFAREADVLERRLKMDESELEKQDFKDRLFPIPKELRIVVKNSANRKTILDLWTKWHAKKRVIGRDMTLKSDTDTGRAEDEHDQNKSDGISEPDRRDGDSLKEASSNDTRREKGDLDMDL